MALHSLVHEEAQRRPLRQARRIASVQLGWSHYWLLVATLGGLLFLVATVFLMVTFQR